MKDKNIALLSTRLLDEALVSEALRHEVTIENISFIKTESVINDTISKKIYQLASESITAVFTSKNAAEAVIEALQKNELQPRWNIYCMVGATQSLIQRYFNTSSIDGIGKNAAELSERIVAGKVKEVTFFSGNQRRDELPENLKTRDIKVKEIVVYQTNETPVEVDKEYNGILFFSPSAVKSFFSVNSIPSNTVLFSIGDTTAQTVRNYSNNKLIISDFPAKDKLVEIATAYFTKTNQRND